PGTTVRIADDGEVLAKGPNVFAGYWHNEEASKQSLEDGWFHTGDVGELDGDGYLKITGRKKEIIVTAAGKNVAPAPLEDRLRANPLISEAVVIGDARPFISALITLDPEALTGWSTARGIANVPTAQLVENVNLRAVIQSAIDDANRSVSRAESIRKFALLPDNLTIADGELTPTLKVRRAIVAKHFGNVIDEMYS